MPQDAPPDGSAQDSAPAGPWSRVAGMQAGLHRWAVADPGRRFGDLFNFVYDPATLLVASDRVATSQGANTPGVDGLTAVWVGETAGVPGFPDDLLCGSASVAGVVVRDPGRLQLDYSPGGVVHFRYRQPEPVPQAPEPFAAGQ